MDKMINLLPKVNIAKLLSLQAFIFLSILSIYPVQAQNIDSLYSVFSNSRGEMRIAAANEILAYCFENEFLESQTTLKTSDNEALVNSHVYDAIGGYHLYETTDFLKSNHFFKLALENCEKIGDASWVNVLNSQIGNNYARMGDYENAIAYNMQCYEWFKSVGDNEGLSSVLSDLGVIYSRWQKPEMALRFYEEAEAVERPLNRPLHYANRLATLAFAYINIDANKALTFIKDALANDQKIELQGHKDDRIAVHTALMGDIYTALDSLAIAEKSYRQSLDFFEKNKRNYNVVTTLLSLGRLQIKAKQYGAAILSLKQSEEIAERNNYLSMRRDANFLLSEAYNHLEPNALSYFYLKNYTNLNDSIFRETSQKQINDFQVRYETAEKQLEIERQQTEINRHRTQQFLFVGSLIAAGLLLSMLTYIVALRTRRNRALTERNDALAETNALKDKFFSIISHDLRNPVIAQRDSLKILSKNANRLDPNTLSDYLRDTHQLADGLADLLANLLNWSKIQTGRMNFNPVAFNLVAVLQSEIVVIKSLAARKNIIFEAHTPVEAFVTGDVNMIKTVVRNLLTNAVKFTDAKGKVVLEIEEIKGIKEIKGYVVSVSDEGMGMTQEQKDNLFRIDQHTREGTAGEQSSGLGLIVCRDLLEKHGSTLHVESEAGKGSRFWFELRTAKLFSTFNS